MGVEIHTPLPSDLREERLLTPQETARLLAVRVETLERWRYSGASRASVRQSGRTDQVSAASHPALSRSAPGHGRPALRFTGAHESKSWERSIRACASLWSKPNARRIPNGQIAAEVLARWGEKVSLQVLSNFYRLRVWRKESSERGEGRQ